MRQCHRRHVGVNTLFFGLEVFFRTLFPGRSKAFGERRLFALSRLFFAAHFYFHTAIGGPPLFIGRAVGQGIGSSGVLFAECNDRDPLALYPVLDQPIAHRLRPGLRGAQIAVIAASAVAVTPQNDFSALGDLRRRQDRCQFSESILGQFSSVWKQNS